MVKPNFLTVMFYFCLDFQGYLVVQDGTKCLAMEGSGVVVTETDGDVTADCTKIIISDHSTGVTSRNSI